jgi:uncharacterized membrane protein (GlpM family)
MDLVIRFLVGGLVVSFFSMIGGALKPKSFAGLFAAAPSVALATISLTVLKKGTEYAAMEAQSMILGAIAFLIYACLVSRALFRWNLPVLPTTSIGLVTWIGLALALRLSI